ncbi:hypothetical protein [Bacillus sp. FSL K6-3431]|uniref:hypothetical protein n=1 Tax=Bacillus sp. FSL K6-3431 TaxID=2921500 RepID=UPI0030FA5DC4
MKKKKTSQVEKWSRELVSKNRMLPGPAAVVSCSNYCSINAMAYLFSVLSITEKLKKTILWKG